MARPGSRFRARLRRSDRQRDIFGFDRCREIRVIASLVLKARKKHEFSFLSSGEVSGRFRSATELDVRGTLQSA